MEAHRSPRLIRTPQFNSLAHLRQQGVDTRPEWTRPLGGLSLTPPSERSRALDALVTEGKLPRNAAGWHVLVCECMRNKDPRLLNAILANIPVRSLHITGPMDKGAWAVLAEAIPHDFAATDLKLQNLSLSKSDGHSLLRVLEGMHELESLAIDNVGTTGGALKLGRHLTLSKLTSLQVSANHTTGAVYPLLRKILKGAQLHTVKFEGLAQCLRQSHHEALASRLKGQRQLKSLQMRRTLPLNGLHEYLGFLKTNSTLTTLDLSDHGNGAAEFNALIKSLRDHPTLTNLTLRKWVSLDFGLWGEPVKLDQLLQLPALRKLDLGYNLNLGQSLIPMFKALETNTSLLRLKLDDTKFNEECTAAFIAMLKSNGTLTHIDLPRYRFKPDELTAVADAMKVGRCRRFRYFNPCDTVDCTDRERAAATQIKQHVQSKRTNLSEVQSAQALTGMTALMNGIQPTGAWPMPQDVIELLARTALEGDDPSAVALALTSINKQAAGIKADELGQ